MSRNFIHPRDCVDFSGSLFLHYPPKRDAITGYSIGLYLFLSAAFGHHRTMQLYVLPFGFALENLFCLGLTSSMILFQRLCSLGRSVGPECLCVRTVAYQAHVYFGAMCGIFFGLMCGVAHLIYDSSALCVLGYMENPGSPLRWDSNIQTVIPPFATTICGGYPVSVPTILYAPSLVLSVPNVASWC